MTDVLYKDYGIEGIKQCSLEEYLQGAFDHSEYGRGELETIKDELRYVKRALGSLIAALYEMDVLNESWLKSIVDTGDFEIKPEV